MVEHDQIDVVCVGFASLDVLAPGLDHIPPAGGNTHFIHQFGLAVGGDAANQSMVLAKLGRRVRLVTLLGQDPAGDLVASSLANAGIDVGYVARTDRASTSVCLVNVFASGEHSFVAGRAGTAATLGADDLHPDPLPDRLSVLSIGSLNASRALDTEVLPTLTREARRRGAVVVADMVTDHLDVGLEDLREVLENVDYLVPSEIELAHFAGSVDPVRAAAVLRGYGVGTVVVKQGSRGATLIGPEGTLHQPSLSTQVVDTTGAGDSFVAGFVSGLVAGVRIEECLRWASASAALSVSAVGATAGIPAGADLASTAPGWTRPPL